MTALKLALSRIAIPVATLMLLAPGAVAASAQDSGCQGGDRVVPVTVFGQPQTAFSRKPAATQDDLQRLFVQYENDLRAVLELARWGGDPDDLFQAVRSGGAIERSMPPGTEFEWMAFRKSGKPACVRNVIWKGAAPFPAWHIAFESKGYSYELVVPKTCLNLSIVPGTTKVVPPPTCELSASFDAQSDTITVRGSTSGAEIAITSVREPGGSGEIAKLKSAGEGVWTYQPSADGRYSFTASARYAAGSQNSDCSASVDVERPKAEMVAPPVAPAVEPEAIAATRAPRAGDWLLRLYGAGADTSGDSIMTGPVREDPNDPLSPFVSTKRMIGDGTGFGLGLERLIGDRYGVELDALFIDLDGNRILDRGTDWTMTSPGVGFDAISLGFNMHLTPGRKHDIFVGPFISNVSYGDSAFNATEPGFGSETGIGAKLGADFYFGAQSPWALSTSLRYLGVSAGEGADQFDLDPLIGTIGLGYRF